MPALGSGADLTGVVGWSAMLPLADQCGLFTACCSKLLSSGIKTGGIQMNRVRKGTAMIFGLAAAVLAAGCSIKLPASSFPGFRVAPPTEHKSGEVETTGRPGQSQESLRQGARAD